MPNIATVLKAEITRLAKKEAKAAVTEASTQTKALKAEVRELRRRVAALESRPAASSAPIERGPGRPRKVASKAAPSAASVMSHSKHIKALRKRLDVTQGEIGGLLGLSNQSIYQYERKNGPLRLKAAVAARMDDLQDETAASIRSQLGERKKPGRKPSKASSAEKQTTAKRGPGRPPKKRGPGRPPKKRGPGRPPKAASAAPAAKSTSVMSHSKHIKALRKKLDVTQGEIGQLLGLSNQSIYQYERKNGPLRLKAPVAAKMAELEYETAESIRSVLGEKKKTGRKPTASKPEKATTAKRGPGRPPKRGPGRPPKAAAKRGPGRPPNRRGPGRPPKNK